MLRCFKASNLFLKQFSGIPFQNLPQPLNPQEEFTFRTLCKVSLCQVTLPYRRRRAQRGCVALQPRSANQPLQKRTRGGKKTQGQNREAWRVRTQRPSAGRCMTKGGLHLKSVLPNKWCLFNEQCILRTRLVLTCSDKRWP